MSKVLKRAEILDYLKQGKEIRWFVWNGRINYCMEISQEQQGIFLYLDIRTIRIDTANWLINNNIVKKFHTAKLVGFLK